VLAVDPQAMDDQVTLRLDRSPRLMAEGVLDHPNITAFSRAEHFVPQAFRIALLEPIGLATMPEVVGVLVATVAATADVVSMGVDDFVIAHVVAPIGGRTMVRWTRIGCGSVRFAPYRGNQGQSTYLSTAQIGYCPHYPYHYNQQSLAPKDWKGYSFHFRIL